MQDRGRGKETKAPELTAPDRPQADLINVEKWVYGGESLARVDGRVVFAPYNQVCQEVSQWCDQGQAQMQAIGNALVTAARNYQTTEDTNAGLSSAAVRGSVRG